MSKAEIAKQRDLSRMVPKARLDRPRFDLSGAALRAASLFEVPQQHVRELSRPQQRFTPAVDLEWVKERRRLVRNGAITVGSVDAGLGLAVVMPLVLTIPASAPITFGIMAALQVAFLPFGVVYSRVRRGDARNFNSFLIWLKARYNITLSAKQALPSFLRKRYHREYESQWFVDAAGRQLRLRSDYRYLYVTQADSHEEFDQSVLAVAPKKVKVAAAQLPAAALALFQQINEHLTVLAARDLSPESDHVVNRAARDRDKVVALHADLVHLGIERMDPEQETAITTAFSTLLAELSAVVNRETKFALDALSVETTYVASRKERRGIELGK